MKERERVNKAMKKAMIKRRREASRHERREGRGIKA